ncbi:hypothetical protein [Orenia marismortui]|uniref:Uncharacterized protein n=1 Tax=Orenia marismortui TaxID=46469 RepID=A0A4R8H118_9FIRM|nr:hypothetical protein [Orenia marismortui]TDX51655.1 hypothetical protein C7959_11151 [Orenia marismortui]
MNIQSLIKIKKNFDKRLLEKDPELFYSKILTFIGGAFLLGRLTKK